MPSNFCSFEQGTEAAGDYAPSIVTCPREANCGDVSGSMRKALMRYVCTMSGCDDTNLPAGGATRRAADAMRWRTTAWDNQHDLRNDSGSAPSSSMLSKMDTICIAVQSRTSVSVRTPSSCVDSGDAPTPMPRCDTLATNSRLKGPLSVTQPSLPRTGSANGRRWRIGGRCEGGPYTALAEAAGVTAAAAVDGEARGAAAPVPLLRKPASSSAGSHDTRPG